MERVWVNQLIRVCATARSLQYEFNLAQRVPNSNRPPLVKLEDHWFDSLDSRFSIPLRLSHLCLLPLCCSGL